MFTALAAMIDGVMHWLLLAGWQAAAIATFVLALSWVLGERLQASWRFCLWLIVLGRLAIPIFPAAPWGIFSGSTSSDAYVGNSEPLNRSVQKSEHAPTTAIENTSSMGSEDLKNALDLPESNDTAKTILSSERSFWTWTAFSGLIWFAGVIALIVRQVISARALAQRRLHWSEPDDAAIKKLFESCKAELAVTRHVALRLSKDHVGPATCGVFFPLIVLPEQLLERISRDDLRLVLLHELVHVKRWDVLLDQLATAIAVLHWFHPVGWFARHCLKYERELACDATVLRYLHRSDVNQYGRVILKVIEYSSLAPAASGLVGIFSQSSPSLLEKRIQSIAGYRPIPVVQWWLSGVLAVSIVLVGWTNSQVKTQGELTNQLTGQVIDAKTEKPISNASLTLYQWRSHESDSYKVLQKLSSDENGNFQLKAMPELSSEPGRNVYLLSIQYAGKSPHVRLINRPEHVAKPHVIALTPPVIVEGQAIDEDGEPVSGAKVFLGGLGDQPFPDNLFCATTDAQGRYAIQDEERPESGSQAMRIYWGYQIHVQHPHYYQQSADRDATSHQVNWKLSKAGSLAGRVLDRSANKPAANVSVVAYISPSSNSTRINYLTNHKTVTDENGSYHFLGLKPEKYNVIVSPPDCVEKSVNLIEVEPERTAQAPDMLQSEECWIEGEVVNAKTGKPVPFWFDQADPVIVEIEGPSHPGGSGNTPTIAVDKNAKFRARVAPGRVVISLANERFEFLEAVGNANSGRMTNLRDFLVDREMYARGIIVKPHETVKLRLELDLPDGELPWR